MFNSAFLLCATDDSQAFWCVLFFGGNVLYYSKDNEHLTRSGFLGTYVDPTQDVTV